jgi:hypothetical protein
MFFFPYKGCAFASEVDKWVGNGRIILDPNAHVAHDAKEGMDIGEVLGIGPVTDLGYF